MQEEKWFHLKIDRINWLTSGYLILDLKLSSQFHFEAGQYTMFRLKDDQGFFDCYYSIASYPLVEGPLQFCILPRGRSLPVYKSLKIGDEICLASPRGDFRLNNNHLPKIFIAGGSGISPLKSMIDGMYALGEAKEKVHLVYGCQQSEAMPFQKDFEKMKKNSSFTFKTWYCAQESTSSLVAEGLVTDFIEPSFIKGAEYYVSGPPPMVQAVETFLKNHFHVPSESINTERY